MRLSFWISNLGKFGYVNRDVLVPPYSEMEDLQEQQLEQLGHEPVSLLGREALEFLDLEFRPQKLPAVVLSR